MKSYKISFYPGMVMPRPYFITVDEPTTDYQALLDILANRLTDEGADGLFDDNEECEDDLITICGNESRRLITGGSLEISEVDANDVIRILQEKAGTDYICGTVDIGFGEGDETEFDCSTVEDTAECWMEFCRENNLDVTDVDYVEIIKKADMYLMSL